MQRLIKLANEKNHYLEKFLSLNEDQSNRLKMGNYDNLDDFYQTREQILEIVRYIDSELARVGSQLESGAGSEGERRDFASAMATKDEYVARILDQDLEVLSEIERAKTNIITELRKVRQNKKAISGYKAKLDHEGALNEKC